MTFCFRESSIGSAAKAIWQEGPCSQSEAKSQGGSQGDSQGEGERQAIAKGCCQVATEACGQSWIEEAAICLHHLRHGEEGVLCQALWLGFFAFEPRSGLSMTVLGAKLVKLLWRKPG